jgi:hypothetical protein
MDEILKEISSVAPLSPACIFFNWFTYFAFEYFPNSEDEKVNDQTIKKPTIKKLDWKKLSRQT